MHGPGSIEDPPVFGRGLTYSKARSRARVACAGPNLKTRGLREPEPPSFFLIRGQRRGSARFPNRNSERPLAVSAGRCRSCQSAALAAQAAPQHCSPKLLWVLTLRSTLSLSTKETNSPMSRHSMQEVTASRLQGSGMHAYVTRRRLSCCRCAHSAVRNRRRREQ